MAKITWKNSTSYQQGESDRTPREYTALVGGMRLVVHRLHGRDPNTWFGTVYNGTQLARVELSSTDPCEAQNELVGKVVSWLEETSKAFE